MLADAPSWLQDWARNRKKAPAPTGNALAGLGEPPVHLTRNVANNTPTLALRAANARAPRSAHDEDQLRSALAFIPAASRDDWLRVGMGIHEAGWGPRGFAIWCEWSQTTPEKYDEADQDRTWESFDRESYNGRRVTLGTIFQMASDRGWTGKKTSESIIASPTAMLSNGSGETPASSDDDKEISRLSKLGTLEYERERKDAAERLNVRTTILDRLVAAEQDKFEGDKKQGHRLSLPEPAPWPESIDGPELLNAISIAIRRHVVMPDHAADAAALWVVHTYLLDCFGISPRLAITSPEKGCGKTTALDVLSHLIFRPLPTANASAAAIFRVVESQRPTLLIDEADTFLPENEELRGILNSGHRQGGYVVRTVVVGEDFEPRAFSTYSACAIALIGRLPGTLADRSVPIQLRRRRADEAIEAFRFDRTEHLDQIARKVARWAADNVDRIRGADPHMPAGVFNRTADNWRPLLAIADVAGGEWPARARRAIQCAGAGDDESVRVLLLADIRAIFTERDVDRLSSMELVGALIGIEDRPWAEWKRGKPISANGVARLLAPFGIAPGTIRKGDETPKGYQLAQFEDAFGRYLPKRES
jgi:putative DNA primase/helicase